MKLLAVDTATPSCSVAVSENGSLLAEINVNNRQTHSRHLNVMIRQAVELAGITYADVEGFAVTQGPGSFTGLRIGMSAVKGLAAAYDRPIVGIPTLEALALQIDVSEGLICPMIDARRGEIYFAGFCINNGILKQKLPTQVGGLKKILDDLQLPCTFVGNGAVLYQKEIIDVMQDRARFAAAGLNNIRAGTVARLGHQRILEGDVDDIATLVPTYLRKSDAELNRRTG